MKIFVINLAHREDRRDYIRDHFATQSLDYEFFPAVYGKELPADELAASTSRERARELGESRELTLAEVGCSLSHIRIYQRMQDEMLPYACVLEDDAILSPGFGENLGLLEAELARDEPLVILLNRRVKRYTAWGGKALDDGRHVYPAIEAQGTDGYVLNLAAARLLTKQLFPVWTVADCWDWLLARKVLPIRCVIPYTVMSNDDYASDIATERHARGSNKARGLAKLADFLYSRLVYRLILRPALRIRKQKQ